jgi:hypothetical protein
MSPYAARVIKGLGAPDTVTVVAVAYPSWDWARLSRAEGRIIDTSLILEFVLDKENRAGILDGVEQQPAGVSEDARRDDPKTGHTEEQLLQRLAVGGPITATAAHRRANDHRDVERASVHPGKLGETVDDLVGNEGDEISEHDLDDGSQPSECHPRGQADDPGLGDRGGDHTVRIGGG